jgi:hypothetical protein
MKGFIYQLAIDLLTKRRAFLFSCIILTSLIRFGETSGAYHPFLIVSYLDSGEVGKKKAV